MSTLETLRNELRQKLDTIMEQHGEDTFNAVTDDLEAYLAEHKRPGRIYRQGNNYSAFEGNKHYNFELKANAELVVDYHHPVNFEIRNESGLFEVFDLQKFLDANKHAPNKGSLISRALDLLSLDYNIKEVDTKLFNHLEGIHFEFECLPYRTGKNEQKFIGHFVHFGYSKTTPNDFEVNVLSVPLLRA